MFTTTARAKDLNGLRFKFYLSYNRYEKENLNRKPFKYLARAVVVNMIPCLSFSPILIG